MRSDVSTHVSLTASGSAATAGVDEDSATGASTAAGSAAATARTSGFASVSTAGASADSAAAGVSEDSAAASVAGAVSVAAASVFSACRQGHILEAGLATITLTLGVLTFFSFLGDLSLDPKNLAKKPLPSALVFSTFSCGSATSGRAHVQDEPWQWPSSPPS